MFALVSGSFAALFLLHHLGMVPCVSAVFCFRGRTGIVTATSGSEGTGSGSNALSKRTVAELREECRRQGLRNYSKLKKAELIRLLTGARTC